jgi:hypothetical protein
MPGEHRVGLDNRSDFLQGLLPELFANLGEHLALRVCQAYTSRDLVAQEAILHDQIQQFLIDGTRHIGQ